MSGLGLARAEALWALRDGVERYLRSRGADRVTVDDVVAETYVVVLRRGRDVPADDEDALAWLCAVARRALANTRRSAQRTVALAEQVQAEQLDGSEMPADGMRLMAAESWRSLPEDDRVVLSLVMRHGVSTNELAELLGCSAGAAAVRLSRARGRVRGVGRDFL